MVSEIKGSEYKFNTSHFYGGSQYMATLHSIAGVYGEEDMSENPNLSMALPS